MEFVEDDNRYSRQTRILQDHAREDALGDEPDACIRTRDVFESNGEASRLTDALPKLGGNARRRQSSRQPSWLENKDFSVACETLVMQKPGYARRLARPRWSAHNQAATSPQSRDNFGVRRINGQNFEWSHAGKSIFNNAG